MKGEDSLITSSEHLERSLRALLSGGKRMSKKNIRIVDLESMEYDELMKISSEELTKLFSCWKHFEQYCGKDMLVEGLIEYFLVRDDYVNAIKKACPTNWQEKLSTFEKVSVCLQEQSNIRDINIQLLAEQMDCVENLAINCDSLYVTIEENKSEVAILLLANLGGDEVNKKSERKYSVWWD